MKRLLAVAFLSLVLTGCEVVIDLSEPDMGSPPAAKTEYPTVNLPVSLRQSNWLGNQEEGSCVHATMISLLRWQGRYNTADYWRETKAMANGPKTLPQSSTARECGTPTPREAIPSFWNGLARHVAVAA